ncbi:MAG: M48 family metalloprotease [Acidimicrobiia bacterium]
MAVRTSNDQVQRLLRAGRARTLVHAALQVAIFVATVAWWASHIARLEAIVAVAAAATFVGLGALSQIGKLSDFAARVRSRTTSPGPVPVRSDPSAWTRDIVARVTRALAMREDTVHPYVAQLEQDESAADLPLAAVLPPANGVTVVLIDDDLEAKICDAAQGGSPYDSHPDDFLIEVRSVIAHELAHVAAWDAPSRPYVVGLAQLAPRFALAASAFVAWEQSHAIGLIGAVVLGVTGLSCASATVPPRVAASTRVATALWMIVAVLSAAITFPMFVVTTLACVLPTVVMTGFARAQELAADRIAAFVVGSGRPLARFLRRFPDGSLGWRGVLASHPPMKQRLGRLARLR